MDSRFDRVLARFSSRDSHRYKTYIRRYLEWNEKHGVNMDQDGQKDIWKNARRMHWFVQEQWRIQEVNSVSDLKSMFNCFRLVGKEILGGESADGSYLDNLVLLYEFASSIDVQNDRIRFERVSVNMWNNKTPSLNERYFKTGLDKVKWLLDFQINHYTNSALEERRTWTLGDVEVGEGSLLIVQRRWAITMQENAFLCPLFALAVYLYLRFYGIKKQYRGDGFPELSDGASWQDLPIIRGKSLRKFPRMETLGNYYPAVFQYCQLPYKKRLYFQARADEPIFPEISDNTGDEDDSCFVKHVGRDFILGMNRHSLLGILPSVEDVADDILLQHLFPSVRQYEDVESAQQFVKVINLLRNVLYKSLPILYRAFPDHDLFQDSLFQTPQFIAYLNSDENPGTTSLINLDHVLLEGGNSAKPDVKLVSHTPLADPPSLQPSHNVDHKPTSSLVQPQQAPDLRKETFQFVKDQTLSNFSILLQMLTKVFDKLETKRSNKMQIHFELDALQAMLKRKISSDEFIPRAEPSENEEIVLKRARTTTSSASEDFGNNTDDFDIEELQVLVQQLVHRQVTRSTELILDRIRSEVRDIVREEIASNLASLNVLPPSVDHAVSTQPSANLSDDPDKNPTTTFVLNPDINSIEDVILEWFTPNPTYHDECVYSMNKKHGKIWRSTSEQESLYKCRKIIVEFYIHLVNDIHIDRHDAVDHCERLRASGSLKEFSTWLKRYKRTHNKFPDITINE